MVGSLALTVCERFVYLKRLCIVNFFFEEFSFFSESDLGQELGNWRDVKENEEAEIRTHTTTTESIRELSDAETNICHFLKLFLKKIKIRRWNYLNNPLDDILLLSFFSFYDNTKCKKNWLNWTKRKYDF